MASLRVAARALSVASLPRPPVAVAARVARGETPRPTSRVRGFASNRWAATPSSRRFRGFDRAARSASSSADAPDAPAEITDPHSFEGARALAKLAMLVYWNAGQPGFWDPEHDGGALDFATPLGFEPLIASDPAALRREALRLLTPAEPALWLDPDPGLGALSPAFATPAASAAAAAARRGRRGRRDAGEAEPFLGVSRAAVVRLRDPDWIVVCFRGTTPSPMRGLLREGQVNSMAGQERWAEAPKAMRDARVHRGYAAAYRSLLADVEGAAADWARAEALRAATKPTKPPPRVVVVGHSLGGALATLCAARLAHDDDFRISPSLSSAPVAPETTEEPRRRKRAPRASAPAVSCVTFGQPRVGDDAFRRGVDEHSPGLRYTRVVRGGDVFARVPTSGIWLPSANDDRLRVTYAHAGELVWTQEDGVAPVFAGKGEDAPAGFNADARMLNPLRAVGDHAGYAGFFEDAETRRSWPIAPPDDAR